ncbi:hypothetical protein BH23CHL2_BH23CHL2_27880 [soil metagenome]
MRPEQLAAPGRSAPTFGTWTLTALLIAIMVVEVTAGAARVRMIVESFSLRSAIWSWTDLSSYSRIFSYSLLHSDARHFFWNAILLLLVGTLIEWRLGLRAVGALFIVGVAIAALSHLLMFPDEARPFIGSSGIVSTLFVTPGTTISVAYWAHLAGFLAGVASGLVYRYLGQQAAEAESTAELPPSFASAGD